MPTRTTSGFPTLPRRRTPRRSISVYRRRPIFLTVGGFFLALLAGLYVTSFFLDDMIRVRTQAAMNHKLKGYHVAIAHAHLQLLGGILTLNGLKVIQQAHPDPPVADLRAMRFHVEWKELFSRRIVADVLLSRPKIHIDQTQLVAESKDKVSLRKKGWQDALEAAYPIKINRLTIEDGDVVYIQDAVSPPLHIAKINFTSDNIRNIHSPEDTYPSNLHARMVIFESGQATIDGHANYLEEPYPGARVKYAIDNVPLSAFDPQIRQINLAVSGGRLSSHGLLEYSPKIARVKVDNATIDKVALGYLHSPLTQQAEARRVKETGKQIEKQNNRAAVEIHVGEFDIINSSLSYTDQTTTPNYRLFLTDAAIALKNVSNHQGKGPADLALRGKFMGGGDVDVAGRFLASGSGPAVDLNLAIQNTNLPTLNDLLRAFGRFDVAAGKFTVFSQINIRDTAISGYVKPMFSDLEVYNYAQDKNKPLLAQARELVIGGASHLFKNRGTQRVASKVDLRGKLSNPNISTWQALVEVLRNAFIQAILPGFDRASNQTQSAK